MNPDVSVVIPTRNRRALLARTLASALAQRDVRLEVIVIDDGSSDGTAEYLEGLSDERVSVVRHPKPRGVATARNAGLERARAPWTAFVDDDDLWAPGKLAVQLAALAGRPGSGWSCVGAVVVDERLEFLDVEWPPQPEDALDRLLVVNVIPGGGSGVLARTDLLRSAGGFDPELRVVADWDMWIRLARVSELTAVDRPLVAYLRHARAMSRDAHDLADELERVAANRGVDIAWERWFAWSAAMHERSGRRGAAALLHLRLARSRRDPRFVARAVMAAAWPGRRERRERRAAASVPAPWRDEAERWLAEIRADAAQGSLRSTAPRARR